MDFSQIDFTKIAAFFAGVGALIKGFLSDSKANKAEAHARDIEEARVLTKVQRDQEVQELKTAVAVLQAQYNEVKTRLAEGTDQFKALDDKVDTTNKLLHEILGALRNRGLEIPDRSMNGGRNF